MHKLPLISFGAIAVLASIGLGQGCGGSSGNTGGGGPGGGKTTQGSGGSVGTTTPGTGGSTSTTTPGTGGSPGTGGMSGTGGGSGGGCNGVELTVHNIVSWCKVSVNGGAELPDGTQTVCVDANAMVALEASPSTGFTLSNTMWHHVDDSTGDTGVKGDQTSMAGKSLETKTVGANGAACTWVCCPGVGNPTECDVGGAFVPSDPCP
jgi:hypothetical protein